MKNIALLVAIGSGALFLSSVAHAHTINAPSTVQAEADGTFSYDAVFVVGAGDFDLASFSWTSSQTDPPGRIGDCFCQPQCFHSAGETLRQRIDGKLSNPTQAAIINVAFTGCVGDGLTAQTTVRPSVAPSVPALSVWARGLMALSLVGLALRTRRVAGEIR